MCRSSSRSSIPRPRPRRSHRRVPTNEERATAGGIDRLAVPGISDFALLHGQVDDPIDVPLDGVAIALATSGELEVTGASTGTSAKLIPGCAVLVTPDEGAVRIHGTGELFIAIPGH